MRDFHVLSDGSVGDCGVLKKDRRQGLVLVVLQGGRGLRKGGFAES